jgi:hypothetical protein
MGLAGDEAVGKAVSKAVVVDAVGGVLITPTMGWQAFTMRAISITEPKGSLN